MSGIQELFRHVGWPIDLALIIAAYAIGCFSTGYWLVRLRTGQDLRTLGSGSCGARNAGRALGSSGFFLTLAGDLAKGGLAVWLAQVASDSDLVSLLALMAVTAGHVWPAPLRFHGGKGIATSLAGLLLYDPWLTLLWLLLFGALFSLTRRTVVSSLSAYALLPLVSHLSEQDASRQWGVAVLALFILIAHHQNIVDGARSVTLRQDAPQS